MGEEDPRRRGGSGSGGGNGGLVPEQGEGSGVRKERSQDHVEPGLLGRGHVLRGRESLPLPGPGRVLSLGGGESPGMGQSCVWL